MPNKSFKTDDYKVSWDESDQLKDKVYQKVLNFFIEHESFNGEQIIQGDSVQIDAPELFAELADEVFKFKVEYKD